MVSGERTKKCIFSPSADCNLQSASQSVVASDSVFFCFSTADCIFNELSSDWNIQSLISVQWCPWRTATNTINCSVKPISGFDWLSLFMLTQFSKVLLTHLHFKYQLLHEFHFVFFLLFLKMKKKKTTAYFISNGVVLEVNFNHIEYCDSLTNPAALCIT